MPLDPDSRPEERELEPIDPKAASRAIKRHIDRRRATEIRRKDPAEEAEPPGASPSTPGHGAQAPPSAESPGEAEILKAVAIRNRDLVQMMEHSPDSLMDEWMQAQQGDDPKPAVQVSRTEMEFLLLKRTLLD